MGVRAGTESASSTSRSGATRGAVRIVIQML
jgi:hypothetical protein